ncbi:ferrous iron transport protein A [bacterium]|nr:ferrous iron transport protein A [bacterium]
MFCEKGKERCLSELKAGESCVVSSVQCECAELKRKLLSLGLTNGREVSVHSIAPLGCPITVSVANTLWSLRKSEASHIRVNDQD